MRSYKATIKSQQLQDTILCSQVKSEAVVSCAVRQSVPGQNGKIVLTIHQIAPYFEYKQRFPIFHYVTIAWWITFTRSLPKFIVKFWSIYLLRYDTICIRESYFFNIRTKDVHKRSIAGFHFGFEETCYGADYYAALMTYPRGIFTCGL
jgi:hypothetical protein